MCFSAEIDAFFCELEAQVGVPELQSPGGANPRRVGEVGGTSADTDPLLLQLSTDLTDLGER